MATLISCLLAILSCQCQTQGERSLIQTDNVLHTTTQLKLIEANTSVTTIPTKVTKQSPMIVTFISSGIVYSIEMMNRTIYKTFICYLCCQSQLLTF